MTAVFDDEGVAERARREATVSVVRSLVSLLTQFGETDKVAFLTQRLSALEEAATVDAVAGANRDLHGVVLGMGGLMDFRLQGSDADSANAELRRLADQLYSLTS